MTGKYGIPYFSNFVNSDMSPEDARSMCCRLRLDNRELLKRGGGLFGANPLTGSIGVVTINLPRIGYPGRRRRTIFSAASTASCRLPRRAWCIKRKVLEPSPKRTSIPIPASTCGRSRPGSGSYWKNHFSTIGIVGMNEACLNFLGQGHRHRGRSALRPGGDGLHARPDRTRSRKRPARSSTWKPPRPKAPPTGCAMLDKKHYPDILWRPTTTEWRRGEAAFYTNSTQLPVNYTRRPVRNPRTCRTTSRPNTPAARSCTSFWAKRLSDIETIKNLVRKVATSYRLPYFTLTPTFSVCPAHGYLSGERQLCPNCGQETEVYSRVVGYLRPIQQWNNGKQAEYAERKTFKVA